MSQKLTFLLFNNESKQQNSLFFCFRVLTGGFPSIQTNCPIFTQAKQFARAATLNTQQNRIRENCNRPKRCTNHRYST